MNEPLHLERTGSGPALLLVHGLGASGHVYEGLARALGSRFTCLRPALPCSGRSGRYADPRPISIAAALAERLEREGIGPVGLVGHSFGGVVCLQLAQRMPSVRGLVLASVPALGLPGPAGALVGVKAVDWAAKLLGRLPPPLIARAYLPLIWGSRTRMSSEALAGYEAAMAAPEFFEAMVASLRSLAKYELSPEAHAGRRIEVLWGERDRAVPLAMGRRLAEQLGAPFTAIPRVGHCVPEEAPELLAAAVERALSAADRGPATSRSRV